MLKWLLIIAGTALLFLWFTRGPSGSFPPNGSTYPGIYYQGYHG